MKLIDFLHYIIKSLDLNYESEHFMYGYIEGLNICDDSVTLEAFGNPFFIKLYELLIKEGRLDIQNPRLVGDETDITNFVKQ